MAETTVIIGARELEILMATLPDKVYRRVVRKAVNKSTTAMLKTARSLAPTSEIGDHEGAGRQSYRKSLGKKLVSRFEHGVVVSIVGSRRGYNPRKYQRSSYDPLTHILEDGHRIARGGTLKRTSGKTAGKSRVTGKRGKGSVIGRVAGIKHLEPAFKANVSQAAIRLTSEIKRGIIREATKV